MDIVAIQSSSEVHWDTRAEHDALVGLRSVLGNNEATFRSNAQRDLIVASMARETDVLAVLPTGHGKSFAWEVPAYLESNVKSVICSPFVALIRDQLNRAARLNISAVQFNPKAPVDPTATLIFTSWEVTNSQAFKLLVFNNNLYSLF